MPDGLALRGVADHCAPSFPLPAKGFRGGGGVRRAWPCEGPFGRTPLRGSAAQKAGIRYERKVKERLSLDFPKVQKGPWFRFEDERGSFRHCQPDALLDVEDGFILFEIKVRFTSDAWFQLKHLYTPVVEKALGRSVKGAVVICKHFDPAAPFPEPVVLLRELSVQAVFAAKPQMGVVQWKL